MDTMPKENVVPTKFAYRGKTHAYIVYYTNSLWEVMGVNASAIEDFINALNEIFTQANQQNHPFIFMELL